MADWKEGLDLIPQHMRDGVARYVEYGVEGGSFLNAVLSNDFVGIINRADSTNIHYLKQWAEYLYWYLPSECHGSREKVMAWIARGGLQGREVQLTESEDSDGDEEGGSH